MIKRLINGFNVVLCESISRDEIEELLKTNECVFVIDLTTFLNMVFLDTSKVKLIYNPLDNLFHYWDTVEGIAQYVFPKENENDILDFVKLEGVK